MEVVKGVEHCWWILGDRLGVPYPKMEDIKRIYQTDRQRMQALADHYVSHHTTPSWKAVAGALQESGLHKQADEITTKYVKGMDVNQ